MSERLDAWLSHRGFGTRSEVRVLVRAGRVRVAGAVCRDQGQHVAGAVAVDGVEVVDGPHAATLLLHKPLGHACSHDPREAPLVEELVGAPWAALPLESAGRLDRDTSGLLVLTTDGQLIHSLTNPRRHVSKRYRVAYRGRLSAHAVERCARGLRLEGDDAATLPAVLEIHGEDTDGLGRCTLHLREGRYHQVRRMIAELGGEVVRLHRDRIGALVLPGELAPGGLREAEPDEVAALFREVGDVEFPD